MLTLPIRVVDPEGGPVAGAAVIPWALRCSQGHGPWRVGGLGDSQPPALTTDADGRADVPYPEYAWAAERVRTIQVTLSVDHPDFVYVSHEFVDVPTPEPGPHVVTLQRGASVEIVPMEDGKPASLDGLYTMWSDARCWMTDVGPIGTGDGALRFPPMGAGKGQVLLVRLDGGHATHFSPIVDLELAAGQTVRREIELHPAVRITGRLSDNVPRPVRGGRLSVRTLLRGSFGECIEWFTWAPIAADGTFTIDAWPEGEAVQVVALCDGYIATSGDAPPALTEKPRVPDPYWRPQVFSPDALAGPITLRMMPMERCTVETVDPGGEPVSGVEVGACPNVGWWNSGANIYCAPLLRGEELLVKRDYWALSESSLASPFGTTTDAAGRGLLELPPGRQHLHVKHDEYELPVVWGRRRQDVTLESGRENAARLVLQPKGTDYLGDWDKLSGVFFGCTGKECRRLIDDPAFYEKMVKIRTEYAAAEDPTDPKLLARLYSAFGEAFDKLDDQEEAAKWRLKAAQEAAKLAPAAEPNRSRKEAQD